MITLFRNCLSVSFDHIQSDARAMISFERTLRIPGDDQEYPLPPGLGEFPIKFTETSRAPVSWRRPDAVMLPMWPSEAMWISVNGGNHPCAIKIATGGINALTGEALVPGLSEQQDYIVVPVQPWVDGYVIETGVVRQFVATRLGEGHSVAEQLLASPDPVSLQLMFFAMTAERNRRRFADMQRASGSGRALAVGAGGKIRQDIYCDPYGISAWVSEPVATIDIFLVPADAWRRLTGNRPPARAPTPEDYTAAGLPWFDYFDRSSRPMTSSSSLTGIRAVPDAEMVDKKFRVPNAQIKSLVKGKPLAT